MLNKNPIDDFFFYSTFDFLEFCLPICSRPPLPPFLYCRCIFVCAPSFHTNSLQQGAFFLIRNKVHVVIGQSKVKCSNAGIPSLIFGGLDNTMDRCTIEPSREEFETVARVDDLWHTPYSEQPLYRSYLGITSALSICLIHLHFPSGESICKPETGWDHKMVMLPKSASPIDQCLHLEVCGDNILVPVCPFSQTLFVLSSSSSDRG